MIAENDFDKLDKQGKLDYLLKTIGEQIAYANELEVQNANLEAENKRLREESKEFTCCSCETYRHDKDCLFHKDKT